MKIVTLSKLIADWCEVCVYKDVCDSLDNRYCENVLNESNEQLNYLASFLYGKNTHVVK